MGDEQEVFELTPGEPGQAVPPVDSEQPVHVDELNRSQLALFEMKLDWKEQWKGMPAFLQNDLLASETVIVNFRNREDRIAFAKLIDQRITPETRSLWYPKNIIEPETAKVWTTQYPYIPRYPIYIVSKGRWESRYTSKALERLGVPYHIVVEQHEYDNYAAVIDPLKVLTLPFSNLGQGSIPARNWIWEHAIARGVERHWILDDNIKHFHRLYNNMKHVALTGAVFCAAEDFTERYSNVGLSGFNYYMFAPRKDGAIKPLTLNTRIYSCILIKNDLPYRWRGRYNEDTDLSIRVLKDGYCTILFNAFLAYKIRTLTMKGGNMDELYQGLGRLKMAQSLYEQHPDIVGLSWKFNRWQHSVNYRQHFRKNKLLLAPGVYVNDEPNEYGMKLVSATVGDRFADVETDLASGEEVVGTDGETQDEINEII